MRSESRATPPGWDHDDITELALLPRDSTRVPVDCNFAANPLCFIDVPGCVFRAVTNTTAFGPLRVADFWMSATEIEGFPNQMGLANAVGDEG
jgi:hypothetical protein